MQKLLVLFFMLIASMVNAQKKSISYTVSLFSEATAMPFKSFLSGPVHPGIQVGATLPYGKRFTHSWNQSVNLYYFFHKNLAQGIGINTEIGYQYRTTFGLATAGMVGVGYLHTFATADEYQLKNGEYIKGRDAGNGRFVPSVALELGWYLHPKKLQSPKMSIKYQSWAEYPYSPGFIPIMTHNNIHIGTSFFLKNKLK